MKFDLQLIAAELETYEIDWLQKRMTRLFEQKKKNIIRTYRKEVENAYQDETKYQKLLTKLSAELNNWKSSEDIKKYMAGAGRTIRLQLIGFVSYQKHKNNRASFTIRDMLKLDPLVKYSTAQFVLKELVAHGKLIYTTPPQGTKGRSVCGMYSFPPPTNADL